jgi:hypothetical protein
MEGSGYLHAKVKGPWYPLDRRLRGPQSRSGHGGEKQHSQPLPGLELPIIQPAAQRYTAEKCRLHKGKRTNRFRGPERNAHFWKCISLSSHSLKLVFSISLYRIRGLTYESGQPGMRLHGFVLKDFRALKRDPESFQQGV